MMQKKGAAWWYIFEFTLGAIIVGLIIYIFFPNLIPYPSKIWDETRSAFDKHEGEFKPYEDQLTTEEKSVDDSMKALLCAIQSGAVGRLDEGYCKGLGGIIVERNDNIPNVVAAVVNNEDKIECDGALFGKRCVECGLQHKFGSRTNKLDLGDLSKISIKCLDRFQETPTSSFCGLIPKDSIEGQITEEDLRKQLLENEGEEVAKLFKRFNLNVYPSPFDSSKSYYIMTTAFSNSVTFLSSDILLNPRSIPGLSSYVVNDMHNKYFKWVEENEGASAQNKFVCNVLNFELPQEIDKSFFSYEAWIHAYGDPRYIAYYEAFPEGEDSEWQLHFLDRGIGWLAFAAIANAVPDMFTAGNLVIKKVGGTATKNILNKATEKVAKEAAEEVGETTAKISVRKKIKTWLTSIFKRLYNEKLNLGTEAYYKKRLLLRFVQESEHIPKEVADELVEAIVKNPTKNIDDVVRTVLKKSNIGEAIGKVEKETIEKYSTKQADELAESLIKLKETDPVKFDNIYAAYVTRVKTGKVVGPDDISDATIADIFNNRLSISEATIRETIEKAGKMSREEIIDASLRRVRYRVYTELDYLGKLSAKELEQVYAFRSMMKNLVKKGGKVSSTTLNEELAEEMAKATKKHLNAMLGNPKLAEKAFDKYQKIPLDMMMEDGSLDLAKLGIKGRTNTFEKKFMELMAEGGQEETIKGSIPELVSQMYKGGAERLKVGQTLKEGLVGDKVISWENFPLSTKWGGLGSIPKAYALPFKRKYLALLGLFAYSEFIASQKEKFYPVEENEMVLLQPKISDLGEKKIYPITPEANQFIQINKQINKNDVKFDPNRFFLVSPCKGDLTIINQRCKCDFPQDIRAYDILWYDTNKDGNLQPYPYSNVNFNPEKISGTDSLLVKEEIETIYEGNEESGPLYIQAKTEQDAIDKEEADLPPTDAGWEELYEKQKINIDKFQEIIDKYPKSYFAQLAADDMHAIFSKEFVWSNIFFKENKGTSFLQDTHSKYFKAKEFSKNDLSAFIYLTWEAGTLRTSIYKKLGSVSPERKKVIQEAFSPYRVIFEVDSYEKALELYPDLTKKQFDLYLKYVQNDFDYVFNNYIGKYRSILEEVPNGYKIFDNYFCGGYETSLVFGADIGGTLDISTPQFAAKRFQTAYIMGIAPIPKFLSVKIRYFYGLEMPLLPTLKEFKDRGAFEHFDRLYGDPMSDDSFEQLWTKKEFFEEEFENNKQENEKHTKSWSEEFKPWADKSFEKWEEVTKDYLTKTADTSTAKRECPHYPKTTINEWWKASVGYDQLTIGCTDISIEKDKSYSPNYCHATYRLFPAVLKTATFVFGLAFDITASSIFGPFTPIFTMASGASVEWVSQKIDETFNRWPGV